MIREITDNLSAALARRMDDEFRLVMNETMPPGWTLDDVKKRCHLIRYHGSKVETLCIDGKPVLEIHEPEFHQIPTETGWTYQVTQNYRKLIG